MTAEIQWFQGMSLKKFSEINQKYNKLVQLYSFVCDIYCSQEIM